MKKYPIHFSIILLFIIILINRIPIPLYYYFDFDIITSDSLRKIIFNTIILIGIYIIIKKNNIPFSFINLQISKKIIYYLPIIIYIIIFSGGLSNIDIKMDTVSRSTFFLFCIKIFISALLEEVLFRGLILGLLLNKYFDLKDGILKSILISSLLFGGIHIINIWTYSDSSIQGVFNQIYAASCLGIMYGAIYLKTRSILLLSVFHFFANFFALSGELHKNDVITNINPIEPPLLQTIIAEIFRLIIFGIPLLVGFFVIKRIKKTELIAIINK